MENGPQDVYNMVDLVENVDGRRQTWSGGLRATFCKYALHNASWIQKLLAAALCVWLSPFIIFEILMSFVRVVVMRLNKLPEWGFEIERECAVEPGDPYIRDAEHLATHDDAFCRAERIKWECELNSRRWKAG